MAIRPPFPGVPPGCTPLCAGQGPSLITNRQCRARAGGFTLVEVLITLVILSTGIVVVLQAFQTSASALGAARDAAYATHLLNVAMDVTEQAEPSQRDGGAFGEPFERWGWERQEQVDSTGLKLITLTVRREGSSARFTRAFYAWQTEAGR